MRIESRCSKVRQEEWGGCKIACPKVQGGGEDTGYLSLRYAAARCGERRARRYGCHGSERYAMSASARAGVASSALSGEEVRAVRCAMLL